MSKEELREASTNGTIAGLSVLDIKRLKKKMSFPFTSILISIGLVLILF